jgi:glucosylceramidase
MSVLKVALVRNAIHAGVCFAGAALLLTACAAEGSLQRQTAPADQVKVWITTSDRRLALSPGEDARLDASQTLPLHIQVDARQRFQSMLGFGASITDASAWLIQEKLTPAQRSALLQELFGPAPGIGIGLTRLTIGASDFSRTHYSLDDMPPGQSDPALTHFSIEPNRSDVLPVARAALAINPRLQVMASPWSAPGWMKTTDALIRGSLRDDMHEVFARYLLRYVQAMQAAGVPIFALTLQNEPSFEPANYPGMRLSASARANIIGKHLGPLLRERAPHVRILDWDHNWDLPQEPMAVLADRLASRYVAGVAWHCYAGDVAAQSMVRDAYPDKEVYMTECSGGDWEPVKSGGLTLQARSLIVDTTRHWARGVLFWNLALDGDSGPHLGGCGNCRGLVTIDRDSGTITRTDDYYAVAHASRFVRRGAVRIASSEGMDGVDNVAFLDPHDGSISMIVVNSADQERRFSVTEAGRGFAYSLPRKSVATFLWHSAGQPRLTTPRD